MEIFRLKIKLKIGNSALGKTFFELTFHLDFNVTKIINASKI